MSVFIIMNHEDYHKSVTNQQVILCDWHQYQVYMELAIIQWIHWMDCYKQQYNWNYQKELAFAADRLIIAKYGFILIE